MAHIELDKYYVNNDNQAERRRKRYRQLTNLPDTQPITEDNLSEWALKHLCVLENSDYNRTKCELLGKPYEGMKDEQNMSESLILNEETLEQQVASKAVDKKIHKASEIYDILDAAYSVNRQQLRRARTAALAGDTTYSTSGFINVLLFGEPGVGKTSQVNQWSKDRGVRIVQYKMGELTDATTVMAPDESKKFAVQLGSKIFDQLDTGESNAVMFLDEFNRGNYIVRGSMLPVLNEHQIYDPDAPGKRRVLKDLVFTIAAANPNKHGNETGINADALDCAELSRFMIVNVEPDNVSQKNYFDKQFGRELKNLQYILDNNMWEKAGYDSVEEVQEEIYETQGRMKLADTILRSNEFVFDTEQDATVAYDDQTNLLNPRTLTNALLASDGTKKSLLRVWESCCSARKYDMMKDILSGYADPTKFKAVDNKANQALQGNQSIFKKKEKTAYDALQKYKQDNGFE